MKFGEFSTLFPKPATNGFVWNNPLILERSAILLTSGWPVMTCNKTTSWDKPENRGPPLDLCLKSSKERINLQHWNINIWGEISSPSIQYYNTLLIMTYISVPRAFCIDSLLLSWYIPWSCPTVLWPCWWGRARCSPALLSCCTAPPRRHVSSPTAPGLAGESPWYWIWKCWR